MDVKYTLTVVVRPEETWYEFPYKGLLYRNGVQMCSHFSCTKRGINFWAKRKARRFRKIDKVTTSLNTWSINL